MEFFEKFVSHNEKYKHAKIIDYDKLSNRIAIVFYGENSTILILDFTNTINYLPIGDSDTYSKSNPMLSESPNLNENLKNLSIKGQNQKYQIFNEEIEEDPKSLSLENSNLKYSNSYSFIKPQLENSLVAIITTSLEIIHSIRWIYFQNQVHLFVFSEEGILCIYKKHIKNLIKVQVKYKKNKSYSDTINPDRSDISNGANSNDSNLEIWKCLYSLSLTKPIKHYQIIFQGSQFGKNNSSGNEALKLYTLHLDGCIIFWKLLYEDDTIHLTPIFSLQFNDDIRYILFSNDSQILYIFSFFSFSIYKTNKKPPFDLLYTSKYEKIISNKVRVKNTHLYMKDDKLKNFNSLKEFHSDSEFSIEDYHKVEREFIDLSQSMNLKDYEFFYSTQPPQFSHFHEFIIAVFFHVDLKKYFLIRIDHKEIVTKCLSSGKIDHIVPDIVMESFSPITFCISPGVFVSELYINLSDLKNSQKCKSMICVINDGIMKFYNIRDLKTSFREYYFSHKEDSKKSGLFVKWYCNNTLIYNDKIGMYTLIKYCDLEDSFGYMLNTEKVEMLIK